MTPVASMWRFIQLLGILSLSALACSDRLPTEPAAAGAQATADTEAARIASPRRPGTRVVVPRATAASQLQGRWGGQNVALDIGGNATVLDFGCAAGSIDGPFVVDASGRFSLPGSWWFTPPVVAEDWQPEKRPARYSGVVQAGTMTLTIVRLDDDQFLGTFTLELNATTRVVHCI